MPASPRRRHVLVVDDDSALLALLCDIFTGAGYRVSTRLDADRSAAEVARLAPDVIVLDHTDARVGVDTGWGLLRRLREDPATATIPVVFCTAAGREVVPRAVELVALRVRVVTKPFDLARLLGVVAVAVSGARTVRA